MTSDLNPVDRDLGIVEVTAFPISYPLPPTERIRVGVGQAVKKDAVVVRVKTEGGLVGYGEAHHGRCPGAVAHLVNTTLRQLVLGMSATDVVGVWSRMYKGQQASHGMGAGSVLAMSGIDMALWDIRGKASGWPLYRLLGGRSQLIPTYAGGTSLGFQEPEELVDEVRRLVEAGYTAVKLRLGDTPELDAARVRSVRQAFGSLEILTDANTAYSLADAKRVLPVLEDAKVGWLEEPFPAHDHRNYKLAKLYSRVPLAAGENLYTRFEFHRTIEDCAVDIFQPDLSKAGGVTEVFRIAAMASAWKIPVHPHTSMTGINMAATVHVLAAIDGGGYFEADVSPNNRFAKELVIPPFVASARGVSPLEAPGIGIEIDEKFLAAHPVIEGPSYV